MKKRARAPANNIRRHLLSLVGAAMLPGTLLAQATVDPNTEPYLTLAPYVLKSSNLEPRIENPQGGTRAYRPWFENGSWTGDLIEYEITSDGVRLIRSDVGRFPREGADWRGTGSLWSARYRFPDYQAYDQAEEFDPNWECTEEDANYWREPPGGGRPLFTMSAGNQVAFLWNSLSAAQRQALDAGTATDATLATDPYASPILNFVRGDRSNERCKEGGTFRWRFSVLGAIVNSTPVYVPAGADGLVMVGANDGMLHGFNAADGSAVFGYVPSMLMSRLGRLRISPYQPTHFVDGSLRARNIGTNLAPRHIVAGGLGAGGKGLFVLDVTDPAAPQVLTELAGSGTSPVGDIVDARIGHIHGRPTIAELRDGSDARRWYVVAGNGYLSDAGRARLVLVPVDGGTPVFIDTLDNTPGNGLSAPALLDANGDGVADFAYAGDLRGNLWRFNLNSREASLLFSAGPGKPITVEPDIGRHPDTQLGFMIYFGTGSLLSAADIENTAQQTVYGIWDRGTGATVSVERLVTQTLTSATLEWPVPADDFCAVSDPDAAPSQATVRFITNQQQPVWTGSSPNLGWQVNFPRAGERLIGRPQIRAERIQFITTNPYDIVDEARASAPTAGSWIIQLDLASGGNAEVAVPLFDLNKNCALDPADGAPAATVVGGATIAAGEFPVGVNLGPYNVAHPTFARVRFNSLLRSVVDGVYINALQLPRPVPSVATAAQGPIDVTTDSPWGPSHAPLPEPAREPFGLRPFPQASGPTKPFLHQDGLGHRVDGHSANYNRHHGVNYVDFFDLEPRRERLRLDIGSVYLDTDGTYKRITPRASEQELNRVTEVGIGADQRFIVAVSNADLSPENTIQIGCRVWPVYEYQTIMMQALRSADPIAALTARNLVFTLSGAFNPIRPAGLAVCADSGLIPTLRLTPTERVGTLDATMATLPGCVNNTDNYAGSAPNAHLTRKSGSLKADGSFTAGQGPANLYATNPHVTRSREGNGYRWRNGALTVQLLAVNPDNTPAYELQPAAQLPRRPGSIEGEDQGWGGVYARAFTLSGGGPNPTVVPINPGSSPSVAGTHTGGMLYELSMFWHWGDMTRFQQQGTGNPVTAFCYGASGNVAPSLMFETEWFTPGAYQQLTAGFSEALQQEYLALLAQLQSDDEEVVRAALIRLAELFADPDLRLADYDRLRNYVPSSKQLNDNHLILIDRGGLGGSIQTEDGTPANVIDIERDLLPSLGPNYRPGRRSWIDLVPE